LKYLNLPATKRSIKIHISCGIDKLTSIGELILVLMKRLLDDNIFYCSHHGKLVLLKTLVHAFN